jgi:enoyl-CoA hydratase
MSETPASDEAPAIQTEVDGRIGRILLNRPQTLNALDLSMVQQLQETLESWRDEPAIHAVVVQGAGRAFCAGGDVKRVRTLVLAGAIDEAQTFFAEEYLLNATIAAFPKPYVALIDGICMGGGLGISIHGSHRIVTEQAVLAMPETSIGLAPDIGASFFLPRLPGVLGLYLGLTGERVTGGDAVHLGLATHFVPHAALASLSEELALDGVAALATHAVTPPPFTLAADRAAINRCFSAETVPEIMQRLAGESAQWAVGARDVMAGASPSSLAWSLGLLQRGSRRDLPACLEAEMNLVAQIITLPDFQEGVRAMIVDKDRKPRWQPAHIDEVDDDVIDELLAEEE